MSDGVFEGLALANPTSRAILAATFAALVLGVVVNAAAHRRYRAIALDLDENSVLRGRFKFGVLNGILEDARETVARAHEPNVQAIVEHRFLAELKPLLLAERFVRAATGLVIILGLLGTFYGLASSIGKLVALVSSDPSAGTDTMRGVTAGLTEALSGMAGAFSNSLVGVASAVVLTVQGIVANLTDCRVGLMSRLEAFLEREFCTPLGTGVVRNQWAARTAAEVDRFADSVRSLDAVVQRFEGALEAFSKSTRDFGEFNAHLKDNVQRMSVSFGDLNDALKGQVASLRRESGR